MKVSLLDVRLRAFLLLLEPALRLARRLHLSLDDIEDATRTSMVRILKEEGLSLDDMAAALKRSRRNIASISKLSGELGASLNTSRMVMLQREIATEVSQRGPIEIERVLSDLTASSGEKADAVSILFDEGILERATEGKVKITSHWIPFETADAETRLDSLRHFLAAVERAVVGRFFVAPPSPKSFARVFSFLSPEGKFRQLIEEFNQRIFALTQEADQSAPSDGTAIPAMVAICASLTDSPEIQQNSVNPSGASANGPAG